MNLIFGMEICIYIRHHLVAQIVFQLSMQKMTDRFHTHVAHMLWVRVFSLLINMNCRSALNIDPRGVGIEKWIPPLGQFLTLSYLFLGTFVPVFEF